MAYYTMYNEGYEELANAIIIQAAFDYRNECKNYRNGDLTALAQINCIEKFFNSEWASLLSKDKTKVILWRLQKEQEEKTKRPTRTVKITPRTK